jgi:2-dehydropantoate 2-reductase
MGCLWAAHLHHSTTSAIKTQASHHIKFISTRAIENTSILIDIQSAFLPHIPQTEHTRFSVESTHTTSRIDTLIVCTKSYDCYPALQQLQNHLHSKTKIILFQNGLGSQYQVLDALPDIPLYAAVTTEGVNKRSMTQIIHAGQGTTRIGPLNKAAEEAATFEQCIHLLSHKGINVKKEHDIWPALWNKLSINCAINPFTALLDCPNGEVKSSELFRSLWPALKHELTCLLNQAGYPSSESQLETLVFQVMNNTKDNISSMLQDTRNKKRTEIDDINGFAYRFLKEKNLTYSANHTLWKEVSKSQKH